MWSNSPTPPAAAAATLRAAIAALILAVGVVACGDSREPYHSEGATLVVEMTRSGAACHHEAPEYTVQAYSDGVVVFDGLRAVAARGRHAASVGQETVRRLAEEIAASGFFELGQAGVDESDAWHVDARAVTLTVRANGATKQLTRNYHVAGNEACLTLDGLHDRVDEVLQTNLWTGEL